MAGSPRAFGEERLTWGGQAARGEFVTMLKVLMAAGEPGRPSLGAPILREQLQDEGRVLVGDRQ